MLLSLNHGLDLDSLLRLRELEMGLGMLQLNEGQTRVSFGQNWGSTHGWSVTLLTLNLLGQNSSSGSDEAEEGR